MDSEKRKYERYKMNIISVMTCAKNKRKEDKAAVIDLSEGGISFISPTMFFYGEEIICNLCESGRKLLGTVKRIKKTDNLYFHAVEFNDISNGEKEGLTAWITDVIKRYEVKYNPPADYYYNN
ncbi:MAG: PilZ domain-containing protein [Elusimicrobiota bacterium]